MPETLVEVLQSLRRAPRSDLTGLRFVKRKEEADFFPWLEVLERAEGVAASLLDLDVAPGQRVGLCLPTSIDFFDGFFGVLLAGAVPAPLCPPGRLTASAGFADQTARLLEAIDAVAVLVDRRTEIALKELDPKPRLGALRVDELLARAGGRRGIVPAPDNQALGLVQFTSGTTRTPKPVALSHRALLAQVRILDYFLPDHDDKRQSGVSWLPLYHDMGLIGCVLPALVRPADLTLLSPELFVARPVSWLRALSRYQATATAAPNFAYAHCVERIREEDLSGVDLGSLSLALNGAETVVPETARRFSARFGRWGFDPRAMTPVYGLAEAALAVTFSAADEPFRSRRFEPLALSNQRAVEVTDGLELASLGRPVPGVELSIRDGRGRRLQEGRLGRVFIRSPSLFEGYLGRPEATGAVKKGDWLDSGDRGFLLDGELYLTGRDNDVVIVRGRNHSAESIETVVARAGPVRTGGCAAVAFRPHAGVGEELLIFVERERGANDNLASSVQERVLGELGLTAHDVLVVESGSLPRTTSGKVRRQETLRRFLKGELRPVSRPAAPLAERA